MKETKTTVCAKLKPEHTIRCGQIIAFVYKKQSNCGFVYRDFAISRVWQSSSQKDQYSTNFFAVHEQAVKAAVKQAVAWMRKQEQGGDSIGLGSDDSGE